MTNEKYKASKWGYCPHPNQSKLFCPRCGCEEFDVFPQSVVANAEYWGWELTCVKCKWIVGADVRQ